MDEVWPHLRHLDNRFDAVVEYLNPIIKGKMVVDLNCGDSRILQYMNCNRYLGTDAVNTPEGQAFRNQEWCKFIQAKDDEVELKEVDVLMCWGIGGHEISHEEIESATITQTIKKLADQHLPKYVVIESIQAFDSILQGILDHLGSRYMIRIDERMNLADIREWNRHIYLLEKNT